jgi:arsenate reductase-like glutaredoxin family protein
MATEYFGNHIKPDLEKKYQNKISTLVPAKPRPLVSCSLDCGPLAPCKDVLLVREELNQYKKKSDDQVKSLEKVVNAQAEMIKEINIKLGENEQRLEDFFKTKNCLKRPLDSGDKKEQPGQTAKKIWGTF